MLAITPALVLVGGMKVTGTAGDWVCALTLVYGLALLGLLMGMKARVVTSPKGIVCIAPFYFAEAKCAAVEKVSGGSNGSVHLHYRPSSPVPGMKGRLARAMGLPNTIMLSPFVSDWENSELVQDIKKNAPHVRIPGYLIANCVLSPKYGPGALIAYYVGWVLLLVIVVSFDSAVKAPGEDKSPAIALATALSGSMGGLLAGGFGLLSYDRFRRSRPGWRAGKTLGLLYYLLPVSGMLMGLLIGMIVATTISPAATTSRQVGSLPGQIALFAGMLQFGLLVRLWLRLNPA